MGLHGQVQILLRKAQMSSLGREEELGAKQPFMRHQSSFLRDVGRADDFHGVFPQLPELGGNQRIGYLHMWECQV